MDRRLATILQTFSLIMFAWFAYSWLTKVHWILGATLCGFTLLNAMSTWGLRERWPVCGRAVVVPLAKRYLQFVCSCTGQQIPMDSSKDARQGLQLRSKQDFDVAEEQAKRIVRGHDDAITRTLSRIHENVTLRKRHRRGTVHGPLASFLIIGDEGVGKRYFSRVLAKLLYGDAAIDVIDCEQISASDLIGVKGSAGELESVRRNPHRMLLFEHVDRAPNDVARILKQLLNSGALRATGTDNEISFAGTVVVLTIATPPDQEAPRPETDCDEKVVEQLTSATGMDAQLLHAVTELMYFALPDDLVKSEVVTLLMMNECRAYHLDLLHVAPEVVATQVLRLQAGQGFAAAPQQVKKLLRKPLVAAAEGQHKTLSLRVR